MNQKFTSFTEKQTFRFLFSILCVIFSALLQTYALKAFLKPAGLLSSGFTGLAILINVIGSQHNIQIPVSLMIVLLNLPVAILCGRSISTKFTILSSLQFVCVSLFLVILPFNTLFEHYYRWCCVRTWACGCTCRECKYRWYGFYRIICI